MVDGGNSQSIPHRSLSILVNNVTRRTLCEYLNKTIFTILHRFFFSKILCKNKCCYLYVTRIKVGLSYACFLVPKSINVSSSVWSHQRTKGFINIFIYGIYLCYRALKCKIIFQIFRFLDYYEIIFFFLFQKPNDDLIHDDLSIEAGKNDLSKALYLMASVNSDKSPVITTTKETSKIIQVNPVILT